jgi:hypothetical protein
MIKPRCGKCRRDVFHVVKSIQYFPLLGMHKSEDKDAWAIEFGDLEEAFDEESWFECESCGKLEAAEIANSYGSYVPEEEPENGAGH